MKHMNITWDLDKSHKRYCDGSYFSGTLQLMQIFLMQKSIMLITFCALMLCS